MRQLAKLVRRVRFSYETLVLGIRKERRMRRALLTIFMSLVFVLGPYLQVSDVSAATGCSGYAVMQSNGYARASAYCSSRFTLTTCIQGAFCKSGTFSAGSGTVYSYHICPGYNGTTVRAMAYISSGPSYTSGYTYVPFQGC